MIFEIVNTILLLCSLMLNIKILNITHNIKNKNKIQNPSASLADIADMMSCDNCEARDSSKENNVSPQNIYKSGTDNENDNIKLLGNNRQDQLSHTVRREEPKEWTEIQIAK